MTDYPYIAPCSYFLIYVYEIPGSVDHAGLLKVGMRHDEQYGKIMIREKE